MYRKSNNTGLLVKSVLAVAIVIAVGAFAYHSHTVAEGLRTDLADAKQTAHEWETHFRQLDDYQKAQTSYSQTLKNWIGNLKDHEQEQELETSVLWVMPLCAPNQSANRPKADPNAIRVIQNAPNNPTAKENSLFDQFGKETAGAQ